jgi:mono/diheme cytochrome c family protein/cbb3-type cytochrome oxidase subunit 1
LIRAHTVFAVLAFVCAWLLDILASVKLNEPDFLTTQPWLTTGRVWNAYSHGMLYGWLGNAFFAFLYFAVPRLAGRRVTSCGLGWLLFVLWNFGVVIGGWIQLQSGISPPPAWGDATVIVDGVTAFTLLLACIQFVPPLLRADWSVSGWYVIAGLFFGLVAYVVDRLLPLLFADPRSFSELWWRDLIGLFATSLALAIAYFVLPAATGRPIVRPFLATLAFCAYVIAYPLSRSGGSPWANGCIAAAMILNAFVLARSCGARPEDVPLRLILLSAFSMFAVVVFDACLQLPSVGEDVRFTDFASARSEWWWIGFVSFSAIGGLLHARQRIAGLQYEPRIAKAGFRLMGFGLLILVLDLGLVGQLIQHNDLQSYADAARRSRPYWLVRTGAEVLILLGFVALMLSTVTGPRRREATALGDSPGAIYESAGSWLTRAALPGFSVAICLALLVMPAAHKYTVPQDDAAQALPASLTGLAQNELRGRAIYLREGCVNCHTQFVRPTESDETRFGVPTQPWELAADPPPVTGSHRVGPDLARERGRKSRDWQLTHLWDPRWVVPDSNMPRFPWLFSGDVNKPTTEALDLIAYLESLGRGVALAGLTVPILPPVPLGAPADPAERDTLRKRGAELFVQNCSGCHGPLGDGNGAAAELLLPSPRALPTACFSDAALTDVLSGGRPGSSMPSWRQLPVADLQALSVFVRSLGPSPVHDVNAAAEAGFPPPGKGQPVQESPVGLTQPEAKKARDLYLKNCQACHGADGDGNAIAVSSVLPAPTAFRRLRPTEAYAIDVINNGVPGTAMTPWREKLSEEDRLLLARYVRSLFVADGSRR